MVLFITPTCKMGVFISKSANISGNLKHSTDAAGSDVIETVVCKTDDLQNGQMKEVDIGDQKALLIKDGGSFYAVGGKCTHYGAPLSKGAYCNGRVRCPWHGACFDVKTGDIEDFPGLDSLPCYKVEVTNGNVKIKADKKSLTSSKRVKVMSKAETKNHKSVLIIGGGPASVACAETLRQEGFTGRISIATKEKYLPYDRPKLTKAMTATPESIALRNSDFHKSHNIDILNEKEASSVDTKEKSVKFMDGTTLKYDSLVVATGGRPRSLPAPGTDLQNVCQLRTPDDANRIADNSKDKNVVIIGSSFIGMEVAAYLVDKATSVTVVARAKVPFEYALGLRIGTILQKLHEDKGVKFLFDYGIKEFIGENNKLTSVLLSDGTSLPADVCVLGIGVMPATDFLKDSGIDVNYRGFIPVNRLMETNIKDVYAAGDVVEFPLFNLDDKIVNVQHYQMAHAQGRTAAYSIMGKKKEIRSVPFFWTQMYGKSVRYTGYGVGHDDVVLHGNLDELKFVAFYTKGEEVIAVASLNYDPIVSQAAELMFSGQKLLKSEIISAPDSWTGKLNSSP